MLRRIAAAAEPTPVKHPVENTRRRGICGILFPPLRIPKTLQDVGENCKALNFNFSGWLSSRIHREPSLYRLYRPFAGILDLWWISARNIPPSVGILTNMVAVWPWAVRPTKYS